MKRLTNRCSAIALAIAVSATGAFAQSQLEANVDMMLTEYGYDVEASDLTRSQLATLQSIDPSGATAEVRAAIEAVLADDANAFPYAPQLRSQADALFVKYDVPADASLMSLNQLAALQSVEDDTSASDEMVRAQIYSIIGWAPDAAQIALMSEDQLEALAQTKLDEYEVEADASALSNPELVAVLAVDTSVMASDAEVVAALRSAIN